MLGAGSFPLLSEADSWPSIRDPPDVDTAQAEAKAEAEAAVGYRVHPYLRVAGTHPHPTTHGHPLTSAKRDRGASTEPSTGTRWSDLCAMMDRPYCH